jgi:hypothetical protein
MYLILTAPEKFMAICVSPRPRSNVRRTRHAVSEVSVEHLARIRTGELGSEAI